MYTILSISDSDKHFDSAIAEYLKRLQKNINIIDLKPSKADQREIAISKDTENILTRLEKNIKSYDQIILLSINGKDKITEERVKLFPLGKKICFIIGGPHGLDEDLLITRNKGIITMGLGKQTMVHGLAKLVLTEQLYRIWMIQQNRNYHY